MVDVADPLLEAAMAAILRSRLGHVPSPWPKTLWREVSALAAERQLDPLALLVRVAATPDPPAVRRLIAAATVPHTAWFRHPAQIDRLRALLREAQRPLRIWSAGCATGEEPYTLALVAREVGASVTIVATDVNADALERARAGRYPAAPLRRLGVPVDGDVYDVPAEVRALIRFEHGSLTDGGPSQGGPEPFDVIFCRNVLLYFDAVTAQTILERLMGFLGPLGSLVVGPVDALRPLPARLRRVEPLGWLEVGSVERARPSAPLLAPPPAPAPMGTDLLERAARQLGVGALDESEELLRTLLASSPALAEAWFLLGEVLERRGETTQAATAFRSAARHAPTDDVGRTLAGAAERRARSMPGRSES